MGRCWTSGRRVRELEGLVIKGFVKTARDLTKSSPADLLERVVDG
jgi:hypothetical protein